MDIRFCGFALCLLAAMTFGGQACEIAAAAHAERPFPLRVQAGKRYLQDASGCAFLMNGDTAWSLLGDLNNEEADVYLRDRRARGFNTVLINLIEHRFARNAPANAYGDRPFLHDGDFSAPNEAYFRHADWVLRRARDLGFVVLLAPAYLGYGGGDQGWYKEMAASGETTLRAYGRFVGQRYGSLGNIVWVEGGDYNLPNKGLVRAVAEGISETDPDALQTAHNGPETAAVDYWRKEPWLSINNVYTYQPVHAAALVQYAMSEMPYFLMESAYENEFGADAHRVRVQAYQAILSGATGHMFGNNPIWHFGGPGLWPAETNWEKALDSPGARSMQTLNEFFSSITWWQLEPDTGNDFLIAGRGNYKARTMSARTPDGVLAILYLPNGRGITLDLAQLAGPLVWALWVDPSTGRSKAVPGSPFSADVSYFAPPTGDHADWILELQSHPVQSQ
ncbi:glycoside hydrolase family 140 protein [Mesorhizobium sp. BR1-1-3]|uniref:apiosidase-like domain-containing protein n=1 Tax=Mesorhizobium sp. BR1-1-3 TaxID=2876651 RepID=UPI001CD18FE8|nr:DUF4038 domain-containing protein [Mesorhizobium sp. BR1-1-3]MBZ9892222.1 glycoside hydrolase family 140 protein [Mesorhizobium sp. BR1-1-3]